MKRGGLKALTLAALLAVGFLAWPERAAAQDEEMLLLDGETWQQLSPESKLAFIWGMTHVVEFERNLVEENWDPEARSFVPHFVAGLKGKTLNDVVIEVDGYYAVSRDRLGHPVIKAVVHTIVLPAL